MDMVVIYLIEIYLGLGLVYYLFLILGKRLQYLDEDTIGTGIGFKLLLLPGTLILWPLLLFKRLNS